MTAKTHVIERLFRERWTGSQLRSTVVTIEDVGNAIRAHNKENPGDTLSDRNPANFFKDFYRNTASANNNWPELVRQNGFTAEQRTGRNECFEFVSIPDGQTQPFEPFIEPDDETPRNHIESVSLPLASRRLGRNDESWLTQVLVRLRVLETHFALHSPINIQQLDHLQMSVKRSGVEIDAIFLGHELIDADVAASMREIIICCEAKQKRDDILPNQIKRQIAEVFKIDAFTQDVAIAVAVKATDSSQLFVVEFKPVERGQEAITALDVQSTALYKFMPPIPGIGE